MLTTEYHKNYGRGRNVSCDNFNCPNFRKKIGRVRGGFARHIVCPICHEEGITHSELCKVSKNNTMTCNCCRISRGNCSYVSMADSWKQLLKDYDIKSD